MFRVTTRGGMICPKVSLYPDDIDWDCECPNLEEVCEHVAASVIAWRRAGERGDELPRPKRDAGRVGYRFTRTEGGLALERVIVHDGREQLLEATLIAVSEGRVAGPRFIATQADLAVELALGTHRRGLLPRPIVAAVCETLSRCKDVRLDDRPVDVSSEPLLPMVRVRDRGDGFVVSAEPGERVDERFGNGILLCGDTLRFPGDPKLTARERDDFERGRFYSPDALAELMTEGAAVPATPYSGRGRHRSLAPDRRRAAAHRDRRQSRGGHAFRAAHARLRSSADGANRRRAARPSARSRPGSRREGRADRAAPALRTGARAGRAVGIHRRRGRRVHLAPEVVAW